MREYGAVSPNFWVGNTGRQLRGNQSAQLSALYLMTSPHATMIGVYYCPVEYMAKETGISIGGASKALQCLIEADFCTYDTDIEWVFVHKFAEYQIGAALKSADKRVQGVVNELSKVPDCQCKRAFLRRYAEPYNITVSAEDTSPIEAPSKPHRSQDRTGTETGTGTGTAPIHGFASFWSIYPKKTAKPEAQKAFKAQKINGELQTILEDIERRKSGNDWQKDGGKWIPHPATYLNGRRWEDEIQVQQPARSAMLARVI